MGIIIKFCGKLQLGPAKEKHSPDIPLAFGVIDTSLYNQDILGPSDLHGLSHERFAVLIGAEEFTHPAHVARREASDIGMVFFQIF